jgi:hypothetical protein
MTLNQIEDILDQLSRQVIDGGAEKAECTIELGANNPEDTNGYELVISFRKVPETVEPVEYEERVKGM